MPVRSWRLVAAALAITPRVPAAVEGEAALRCRLYLDEADYRSSASRPVDAFTGGLTGT
jgi:hypothetical protein